MSYRRRYPRRLGPMTPARAALQLLESKPAATPEPKVPP